MKLNYPNVKCHFCQFCSGAKNFETLVDAVMPLFANDSKAILAAQEVKQNHSFKAHLALRDVWQSKLGLNSWPKNADDSEYINFLLGLSNPVAVQRHSSATN